MKKVLYLHGLEASQGGKKVDFLSLNSLVVAPEVDYSRKDILSYLTNIIEEANPDIIIGSSIGGYTAFILGALYDIPVIAFNPALHSRHLEPNFPPLLKNKIPNQAVVVLGEQDTIINPKKTLEVLKDYIQNSNHLITIESIKDMGHRVSFDVFVNIYNKIK